MTKFREQLVSKVFTLRISSVVFIQLRSVKTLHWRVSTLSENSLLQTKPVILSIRSIHVVHVPTTTLSDIKRLCFANVFLYSPVADWQYLTGIG